jgi:glutamine synthetase
VAARNGKTATFMPRPLFGEPGSSLRVRQALWKDGKPLFYDASGYAGASQTMLYYIGGLLAHADSLLAFTAPTTNSYRRDRTDRRASAIAFSSHAQAAVVRIATTEPAAAKTQRVEFRAADPSANPYLAFAAMLCAGLDGIRRRIDPVRAGYGPLDANHAAGRTTVASLEAALAALSADREYLTVAGVFAESFVSGYIERAMTTHVDAIAARPHPYEFELSYDV